MTSIASSAPPGGRGAPPGGEEPPGGRSAPGGRPPRLSIGRQGGKLRRPRLPGTLGGRLGPGQKQVIKTTVKDRRGLLREELAKYRKSRTDLSTGTTEAQGGYTPPKGMGKKPARERVSQAGTAASEAAAGNATPPKQAANMPPAPKAKKAGKKSRAAQASTGRAPVEQVEAIVKKQNRGEPLTKEEIAILDAEEAMPTPATAEDRQKQAELRADKEAEKSRLAQKMMDDLKNKPLGSPGHQTVLGKQENILEARERVRAERQELDPSMLPPELGGIGLKGKIVEADPGSGAQP